MRYFYCLLFIFLTCPIIAQEECYTERLNRGEEAFDEKDYSKAILRWNAAIKNCDLTSWQKTTLQNRINEANKLLKPPPALSYEPQTFTINGGTFEMGDVMGDNEETDEKPLHSVYLSSFAMGKFEITNEQFVVFLNSISDAITISENGDIVSYKGNVIFELFCGDKKGGCSNFTENIEYNGGTSSGGRFSVVSGFEKKPVVMVSWHGATAYCDWLSQKTNKKYRLATEAEWEYAAREGGKKNRFGNGKNIADASEMNFNASESYKKSYSNAGVYRGNSTAVGSFTANALGLYDMAGNVWEWCSDWYSSYSSSYQSNPTGAATGSNRVYRGGSWINYPRLCRASNRLSYSPALCGTDLGFRVVLSLQ